MEVIDLNGGGLKDGKKRNEELLNKLSVKNKKKRRLPGNQGTVNPIKYKYIEGSGTQITYDLKFKFFF